MVFKYMVLEKTRREFWALITGFENEPREFRSRTGLGTGQRIGACPSIRMQVLAQFFYNRLFCYVFNECVEYYLIIIINTFKFFIC